MRDHIITIGITVILVFLAWAIFELARTIRKARETIDDLGSQVSGITASAAQTIDQVQPIITKVDGMVEDLEPAVQQIQPLLERASTAVDVVTVDLASVNDILVDVSSVTDTASNVTSTVSKAANSAVSGVAGVVGKFTAGGKGSKQRKLEEKATAAPEAAPAPTIVIEDTVADEPQSPKSYFTYDSGTDSE